MMYLQSSFIVYSILEKRKRHEELLESIRLHSSTSPWGVKKVTREDIMKCVRGMK